MSRILQTLIFFAIGAGVGGILMQTVERRPTGSERNQIEQAPQGQIEKVASEPLQMTDEDLTLDTKPELSTEELSTEQSSNAGEKQVAAPNLIAHQSLSAGDVVRKQMQAIRLSRDTPERLRDCYEFASPSNRKFVGSYQRFSKLMQESPYNALAHYDYASVGRPVFVEEDVAIVLVTCLTSEAKIDAFRFVVALQTKPPFENRWMTESVMPLPVIPQGETQQLWSSAEPTVRGAELH